MIVSPVNANMNAKPYPMQLSDKVKRSMFLALSGSTTSVLAGASYLCKSSVAKKYPWLVYGAALIGQLGMIIGFGAAAKAQVELNKYNAGLKIDA